MSRNIKSSVAYASVSAFAFIFNKIYALFSHGVSSDAMSEMWIWLLILGTLFYILLETLFYSGSEKSVSKAGSNVYNSGTAVVIVGMLIQGIVDIAGTGSDFIIIYRIAGISLMVTGAVIIFAKIISDKRK